MTCAECFLGKVIHIEVIIYSCMKQGAVQKMIMRDVVLADTDQPIAMALMKRAFDKELSKFCVWSFTYDFQSLCHLLKSEQLVLWH